MSAVSVAFTALFLSICSIFTYSFILASLFLFKTVKKNKELSLFYARFAVDVLYSLSMSANLLYVLLTFTSLQYFLTTHRDILFFVAWPNFNLTSVRALLVFAITLDRTIGAYLPIHYHNHRKSMSNRMIVGVVCSYGLFEYVVLFGFCGFTMHVPADCSHFSCSINTCYRTYWLRYEQVIYSMIGVLSLALCIRLYIWNNCRTTKKSSDLSKANRLALLDTFISFFFDLLPSFILSYIPSLKFENIGPINALGKSLGIMIEVIIVWMSLQKQKQVVPKSVSTNTGQAVNNGFS